MTLDEFLKKIRDEAYHSAELGTRFEKFVKAYLLSKAYSGPLFTDVWLWGEFPYKKGHDTGIDLVARDTFGDFVAVQCKCYQPGTVVSKEDVDTFLSASGKTFYVDGRPTQFVQRILVSTNDKWSSNAEEAIRDQNPPVARIGLSQLRKSISDVGFFDFEKGRAVVRKLSPLRHQDAAIHDVLAGFDAADRGQLVMACGTGKTYTSLRIAEELKCRTVLFMVPSISLLSQSLRVWAAQARDEIATVAVCSDAKADREEGDISVCDLGFPATTSAEQLQRYGQALRHKPPKGMTVVFSTYQSVDAVSDAQKRGAFGEFDLIVCDEAHRTTGQAFSGAAQSSFTKIHDNANVRGKRRLYMTATPRVYAESAKKQADAEKIEIWSMDDAKTYGSEFHHLSFSAAVSKGLLSDYKVEVLAVAERDIRALGLRDYDGDGSLDNVEEVGKWIGCWKAFNKRFFEPDMKHLGTDLSPMRSVVAFSSSIRDSKIFTGGLNGVAGAFAGQDGLRPARVRHVDGTMNALERASELDWLRRANDPGNTECRILSNAKCLSEGVDVPGLDAIAFLSPKNSFVEIVQAVGRVMRKAPGKQFGYVVIPVVIPEGLEPDAVLSDNKRFKVVWDILSAIRSHDDGFHTLDNKVSIVRVEPLRRHSEKREPEPIPPPPSIPPELFGEYQKAIKAKLAKVCGEKKYWSTWATEVAAVVKAQIERIRALLSAPGNPHETAFSAFLESLRANLNGSITREDAIEMLAQQLVSAPIFSAVFSDFDFVAKNPVSQSLAPMLQRLNESMTDKDRSVLESFYQSVRNKASGQTTSEQKQHVIIELYNNFFNIAFKDTVEKLGIVYTPVPCVDFIIHSVAALLKKHFGKSVGDRNVHFLDPFTGTGTFPVRFLQSGLIRPKDLRRKYEEEIHANEIVLLAYYIAAINIEAVFHDLMEKNAPRGPNETSGVPYRSFPGIVLADTFQMGERQMKIDTIFPENSNRAKRQNAKTIQVIVGNPPYNVARGVSYPALEDSIRAHYVGGVGGTRAVRAVNINSLYDSYIKAFRWASDRIRDEGIVAFISNAGWLDGAAMSGMRASFQREFSDIYVLNLRGNQRTSGETSRREGGKIFGSGSRTPIAITILVKKSRAKSSKFAKAEVRTSRTSRTSREENDLATIHYHDIGDYLSREEKLKIVEDFHDVTRVPWRILTPDSHNDWLNQRNGEFDSYVPLAPERKFDGQSQSFFVLNSSGVKTGMDAVAINYSRISVLQAVKGKTGRSSDEGLFRCIYRPFSKQWLYYDREVNQRQYRMPSIFPLTSGLLQQPTGARKANLLICVKAAGKSFSCFISDCIPDIQPDGGVQCFPLYWYEGIDNSDAQMLLPGLESHGKYIRHDGISDFILHEFEKVLGSGIRKKDIFYYVYGALHSPSYRAKFEADLRKQLPRLPLPEDRPTFDRIVKIGRDLARLHLNYERVEPWPLAEVVTPSMQVSYRVDKLRFGTVGAAPRAALNGGGAVATSDRSRIVVNPTLQLVGIPEKAYEYVVNGRSAIEWIIDRYQIRIDKESGIVNDPNKWGEEHGDERYIVDLLKRIVRVSMESVNLIAQIDGAGALVAHGGGGIQPSVAERVAARRKAAPQPEEGEYDATALRTEWRDAAHRSAAGYRPGGEDGDGRPAT